jgi:hypothetical protein
VPLARSAFASPNTPAAAIVTSIETQTRHGGLIQIITRPRRIRAKALLGVCRAIGRIAFGRESRFAVFSQFALPRPFFADD